MDRIRPAVGSDRAATTRANNGGFQMYAELPSRRAREKKQRNEKCRHADALMLSAEQDHCFGRIPDRWLDYCPFGRRIANTPFICFKTPLHPYLLRNCARDVHFTVDDVVACLPAYKHLLIVCLTGTTRYYNFDRLRQATGAHHLEWVQSHGHNVHNEEHIYRKFAACVNRFLDGNRFNASDTLIGVHCTHGVNRTGYLVCRYLIEKCNYSAVDAVAAFELARGHPIEREEYVQALHNLRVDDVDDCNVASYNHRSRGEKYGSNHVLPSHDVDDLAKRHRSCDDPNVEQSTPSSSRHQYRRVHSQGATLSSTYHWQHTVAATILERAHVFIDSASKNSDNLLYLLLICSSTVGVLLEIY